MKIIAKIRTDFPEKFGIPRQSGLVDSLRARIVFEPEFRVKEALRGIEDFSHLWLIWEFSEAKRDSWSPTVRPPRLGGNKRMGVFATRSPFRPNAIGLSSVRLVGIEHTANEGDVLIVSGWSGSSFRRSIICFAGTAIFPSSDVASTSILVLSVSSESDAVIVRVLP